MGLRGTPLVTHQTPVSDPEVVAAHEHLQRSIGHLRRNVDYWYPPNVTAENLRDVQRAQAAYREAVKAMRREQQRRFREERTY